jgi:hypothetical protein
MAQVEAAVVLSVVVRSGPVRTAVNGTLVARPAETTSARPGSVGTNSTARVRLNPVTPASSPRTAGPRQGSGGIRTWRPAPSPSEVVAPCDSRIRESGKCEKKPC